MTNRRKFISFAIAVGAVSLIPFKKLRATPLFCACGKMQLERQEDHWKSDFPKGRPQWLHRHEFCMSEVPKKGTLNVRSTYTYYRDGRLKKSEHSNDWLKRLPPEPLAADRWGRWK